VAGEVARTILKNQVEITNHANLDATLEVMRVLIREGAQAAAGPIQRKAAETEETLEEQGWLARIVHLIRAANNDEQLELLRAAQRALAEGNERIKFTYPPLVFAALRLARRFKTREHLDDNWSAQTAVLYKTLVGGMLTSLYTRVNGFNDMALRLFVACARVADQTGHAELAYDFFAQAFTVYEEVISDSKAQFQAICVLAGALHQTRGFAREDYDTLITKCALHGSKLLKKPDQCRAVYLASHLWWATEIRALNEESAKDVRFLALRRRVLTMQLYRDGKRVLECLQRALRVSDSVVDAAVMVELFVEVSFRHQKQEPANVAGSKPIPVLLRAGERDHHGALRQRAHRADPLEPAQRRVVAVARQRAAAL
jgi:vacuolar protein sorting-associated protein 35